MLIPIDRPMIDARNIRDAATQTVDGGFVATHNQKAVLLLTCFIGDRTSGAPHIQAGIKAGQLLTILVTDDANKITITDGGGAGTELNGDWVVADGYGIGAWLKVIWTGTVWQEVGRGNGELTASGLVAHAEGSGTTASGDRSHAEGNTTTASGAQAHAEGNTTTATGESSHAMGEESLADQKFQYAHGGDKFAVAGDAQYCRFILRKQETHGDNSWRTIGIDASAIGPVLPDDGVWTFKAQIVGTTAGAAKVWNYEIDGSTKRVGNTTTLLAMDVETIHEDDANFEAQAVADDVNDALSIQVKDAASGGDVVRWVVTLHITQVVYED